MRIDILVPVNVDIWDKGILERALKCKAPDTDIVVTSLKDGIASVECDYDVALAAGPTVTKAVELEDSGSQAIIIYCFAEPAVVAAKEKLDIPVIGIREASIALASIMGDKIGVIAPIDNTVPYLARRLSGKVERIVSMDLPVLDYLDYAKLEGCVDAKTGELVDSGCDVIVLGCGSIMNINFKRIEEKHGISIVEPIVASVSIAECMLRNSLSQSKIAYPSPPEK
jgi:allantoin racemase